MGKKKEKEKRRIKAVLILENKIIVCLETTYLTFCWKYARVYLYFKKFEKVKKYGKSKVLKNLYIKAKI